jgi:hypothetical protein
VQFAAMIQTIGTRNHKVHKVGTSERKSIAARSRNT